jgi:signal transduction histidine kinase
MLEGPDDDRASASAGGSRAGYESARLELARLRLAGGDARAAAMRQITQTTARALGAERVGIWAFKGAGGGLVGVCQFDLVSGTFPPTGLPDGLDLSGLLADLHERRVVAIAEAPTDPRTRALGAAYLAVHHIESMLLAPVIRDAAVVGAICCEQVGRARAWSLEDRDFGACAADMAALFLEQADRLEIESSLRARREAELANERMAALGRLARSVAHDINNLLGAIDLIGVGLEADGRGDVAARGAEIRRTVDFGSRMVQQLFLFGREAGAPASRVELASFLRRVEPVLRRLLRDTRLEIAIAIEGEVFVLVERAELKQMLLNLCLNAAEAMAPGGLVRVELREPRADEQMSPTSVLLSVADDGQGMDAATQARMFEPYFSTKGAGHGVGLATVYGIVKRAGGQILVASAVGSGTTFRIALPRATGAGPGPEGAA